MQHWFNQHSFLVAAAAALLLLAALLLRDGLRPADLLALGALCLGLALAYAARARARRYRMCAARSARAGRCCSSSRAPI